MASILENLNAAQASAATELATIAALRAAAAVTPTPGDGPNYSIEGVSVSKVEYLRYLSDREKALTEQIDSLQRTIINFQPFSIVSKAI